MLSDFAPVVYIPLEGHSSYLYNEQDNGVFRVIMSRVSMFEYASLRSRSDRRTRRRSGSRDGLGDCVLYGGCEN
jgi:hypothetical protein